MKTEVFFDRERRLWKEEREDKEGEWGWMWAKHNEYIYKKKNPISVSSLKYSKQWNYDRKYIFQHLISFDLQISARRHIFKDMPKQMK